MKCEKRLKIPSSQDEIPLHLKEKIDQFRVFDWWGFKLSPILGLIYLLVYILDIAFFQALVNLGLFVIAFSGIAAFGFLLNDWSDLDIDKQAGKSNSVADLKSYQCYLLFLISFATGVTPWFFLPFNKLIATLVVLQYVSFILYSISPFRFKGRHYLGVLIAAFYEQLNPYLITLAVFYDLSQFQIPHLHWMVPIFIIWALAQGHRNYLYGQLSDFDTDRQAGLSTFVTYVGKDYVLRIVKVLLPIEVICWGIILIYLGQILLFLPVLHIIVSFYIWYRKHYLWHKNFSWTFKHYSDFYLDDFYRCWFPIVPLFYLSLANPLYIIFFIGHLILFQNGLHILYKDWKFKLKYINLPLCNR